jgi:hypothetical protein
VNTSNTNYALAGTTTGTGSGVMGIATSGYGIVGYATTGIGVGASCSGANAAVSASNSGTGNAVTGSASAGVGVYGTATGNNPGIYGFNNGANGIGIYGDSAKYYGGWFQTRVSATNVYALAGYNQGSNKYAYFGGPTYAGYFGGNVYVTGTLTQNSDVRYKTNIATLPDALNTVLALRGVSYDWRRGEFPNQQFPEGRQIGLIAQEVQKVQPSLVSKNDDGHLGVNYSGIVPILVESTKALQHEITDLKASNAALAAENAAIKARLDALERRFADHKN